MKRLYWFLFSTVALLLALMITAPVTTAGSQPKGGLTTPQLIDVAYAQGEISAEQRILYLAYAVYEPTSLPAQYNSPVGWYGTQAVREIHAAYANDQAALSRATANELARLLNPAAGTTCDVEDPEFETTSTHFYYNYGTIAGGLAINDYVTSMEAAFTKIVTEYGWAQPPLCTADDVTEGGCDYANDLGGSGLFPVTVAPIGSSLFGYVTANLGSGDYAGVVGDNPNTAATETEARASCMVLNSDFSQFTENTAQENLDATTSHEYVHAVQNGYGDPTEEDAMWYESVAAYFEDEMNDASNTANLYLWPETTNCLGEWPNGGNPGGISQYSNFIFFRHVAENTGGANVANGGENTIQQLWANIGAGQTGLQAMNNALLAATPATNLNDAFHNYGIAVKGSKACGAGYSAPYCFEEGAQYVASNSELPANQISIDASPATETGTVSEHYAINYVGLPNTGTYTIQLDNTAASGVGELRGSVVCDTGSSYAITPLSAVVGNGESATAGIDATACTAGVTLVITNQGTTPNVEPPANACSAASRAITPYRVAVTNTTTAVAVQSVVVSTSAQSLAIITLLSVLMLGSALALNFKRRS